MSEEKKKPWGDAFAIKPGREMADGELARDVWIPLGPVWESDQGNFSLTLDSEPIHWRDARTERRVVITRRKAAEPAPTTTGRGGRK